MKSLAIHLVGLLRSFDTIQPNFKGLIGELKQDFDITLFVTVWDKSPTFNVKKTPNGFIKDNDFLPINQENLSNKIHSFFPDIKCEINIHQLDDKLSSSKSFSEIIFKSYTDRLKFELDQGMIFDRVLLTRTDILLSKRPTKKSLSECLAQNTVNQLNFTGNYCDLSGFMNSGQPEIKFITHASYDFLFYGPPREMNLLMMFTRKVEVPSEIDYDIHLVIASVLKKFGILIGNQSHFFELLIMRLIEGEIIPDVKELFDGSEIKKMKISQRLLSFEERWQTCKNG